MQQRLDAVLAAGRSSRLRAGKPSTSPSKTAGAPAFQPSTSTPKICFVLLARYWSVCVRGSALPSSEMNRRTRPSSGWALRAAGKEIAKRSGPADCARAAKAPPPATASESANPRVKIERCIGGSSQGFYRRGSSEKTAESAGIAERISQRSPRTSRFLLGRFTGAASGCRRRRSTRRPCATGRPGVRWPCRRQSRRSSQRR